MEISNLMACDRAFGRHINECPWESRLLSLRDDFNHRPASERIYRGENEDSDAFLTLLARSADDGGIRLPVVGYFRDLGFGFASSGKPIEGLLPGPGNERRYKVRYAHYLLNYRIVIAAHSRAEVHEVALPLHYYLFRNGTLKTHHLFFRDGDGLEQESRPLGFSLPMTIINPGETVFRDTTSDSESVVRIYSAAAEYRLKAPVFFMNRVEPLKEEIEFMEMLAL